jgi:hypothetical protein
MCPRTNESVGTQRLLGGTSQKSRHGPITGPAHFVHNVRELVKRVDVISLVQV